MRFFRFIFCGIVLMGSVISAHPIKQEVSDVPEGPKIKVLLAKNVPSVLLEAKGSYKVIDKESGSSLGFGLAGKRFVCHSIEEGLRWGEEFPDVYQFSVVPAGPETTIYVDGIQYAGAISVYQSKKDLISVVNEVTIEDFLKSTLSLHYDAPLPKEALAALVIAERTNAYAQVSHAKPWDITAWQAKYYGLGVAERKNGVEEAVDATRFMVIQSSKSGKLMAGLKIAPGAAEELAERGYDARKILSSTSSEAKLSLPAEVRFR